MLDRITGSAAPDFAAAATQAFAAAPAQPDVARTFQALLSVGYLAAAADGLAPEEKAALSSLLARSSGSTVDKGAFDRRIAEIEAECASVGADAALERAAAELSGPFARREAVVFATLVAIADGTLAPEETEALVRLGAAVQVRRAEVIALIEDVVQSITKELDKPPPG